MQTDTCAACDTLYLPCSYYYEVNLHSPMCSVGNCVAAARRKDNRESRDEARRSDPAVEDAGMAHGGWLDMSKNTPFGMRETTAKFAFQVSK